jgi:hypothetical protein
MTLVTVIQDLLSRDALPRTPSLKVDLAAVRAMFG